MPPNMATTFSLAISSRAATTPLGGHEFIVALDQLELAAAEQATLGIDLFDGDGEPAGDRLARLRRSTGQRRHVADLDRLLRQGRRLSRQHSKGCARQSTAKRKFTPLRPRTAHLDPQLSGARGPCQGS